MSFNPGAFDTVTATFQGASGSGDFLGNAIASDAIVFKSPRAKVNRSAMQEDHSSPWTQFIILDTPAFNPALSYGYEDHDLENQLPWPQLEARKVDYEDFIKVILLPFQNLDSDAEQQIPQAGFASALVDYDDFIRLIILPGFNPALGYGYQDTADAESQRPQDSNTGTQFDPEDVSKVIFIPSFPTDLDVEHSLAQLAGYAKQAEYEDREIIIILPPGFVPGSNFGYQDEDFAEQKLHAGLMGLLDEYEGHIRVVYLPPFIGTEDTASREDDD